MSKHRESILREMGLGPLWRIRAPSSQHPLEQPVSLPVTDGSKVITSGASSGVEMGGQGTAKPIQFEPRSEIAPTPAALPDKSPDLMLGSERRLAHIASLDWDALENEIRACTACRLCESRQQAVPGIGDRNANWMMVGEGPGAEEDRRGEPFVGPAGQLLDDMLAAIGLGRSQDVYIANAVKCRPPLNRTPQADEINACLPYLERQISLVKPKLLIALGRPAAQSLLGEQIRINASRGRLFSHGELPVVITYHPAYLLRNQPDKGRAWEDLCFARATMLELAKPSVV